MVARSGNPDWRVGLAANEALMAVDSLQKQRRRGPGRRFEKGESGNPAGRPAGSRNKGPRPAEPVLGGASPGLARNAVGRALGGEALALRVGLPPAVPPVPER